MTDDKTRPVPRPPLSPREPALPPRLVLVGPPAAGKSTLGRLLSERFDVSMRDTDMMLAAMHGPIPTIFSERGEVEFRRLEMIVVDQALRELKIRPGVLSLGGGAILNAATRAQLADPDIVVVLIDIDAQTVAARISGTNRPLLAAEADTALEKWQRLVSEREPLYREVATVTAQTSNLPPATVVERIVSALARHEAAPGADADERRSAHSA